MFKVKSYYKFGNMGYKLNPKNVHANINSKLKRGSNVSFVLQ